MWIAKSTPSPKKGSRSAGRLRRSRPDHRSAHRRLALARPAHGLGRVRRRRLSGPDPGREDPQAVHVTEHRTAAFAAHFSLSHACWLAAYPLAGWLGAAAGLQAAVLALAAVALAAAVLAVRSWPADSAEAPAPVAHSEGAHVHANLPATHPHLADAVLAPGGFRHHHAARADRLHAA